MTATYGLGFDFAQPRSRRARTRARARRPRRARLAGDAERLRRCADDAGTIYRGTNHARPPVAMRVRAHNLGTIEAPDQKAAEAEAVKLFSLTEEQRKQLMIWER
jgi:hypothetical protein